VLIQIEISPNLLFELSDSNIRLFNEIRLFFSSLLVIEKTGKFISFIADLLSRKN